MINVKWRDRFEMLIINKNHYVGDLTCITIKFCSFTEVNGMDSTYHTMTFSSKQDAGLPHLRCHMPGGLSQDFDWSSWHPSPGSIRKLVIQLSHWFVLEHLRCCTMVRPPAYEAPFRRSCRQRCAFLYTDAEMNVCCNVKWKKVLRPGRVTYFHHVPPLLRGGFRSHLIWKLAVAVPSFEDIVRCTLRVLILIFRSTPGILSLFLS